MSQPFYHLRPNKYVDRCLFINTLERLNALIDLKKHRYIGFGSYLFDDFKLIHDRINISSMISLEADENIFKRAKYNVPYKCIKVVNQTSTDYISSSDWGKKKTIIWLDYTDPKELAQQFSDIASLTNIVGPNDVIRVTFNANSSSLGKPDPTDRSDLREYRLNILRERIGEYIPINTSANELTNSQYPILLLKCLQKMFGDLFTPSKYDKRFLLPLFSTVYKDGQTMLTFTGIILDDYDVKSKIINLFKDISYINFCWDMPSIINIPELTVKEMLEINKLLPSQNAQKQLFNKFDFIFENNSDQEINSYISFYKYYPSFQSVNF